MSRRITSVLNGALLATAVLLAVALLWQRDQAATWRREVADARARLPQSSVPAGSDAPGTGNAGALVARTNSASAMPSAGPAVAARSRGAASDATAARKPKSPEAAERARIIAARQKHQAELNTLKGYDDGFTALGLPAALVDQARQLILRQQQASEDAAKGRPHTMEEMVAAADAQRQALRDQLTALLGQGVYQQLEAYHREGGIDWTVGTDLWDAGVPLSRDQLHALALAEVQVDYQNRPWPMPANPAQPIDPATGLTIQDVALLANSSRFLSPAQQQALRQSLIEDHQYDAAMAGFSAKQRGAWEAARGGKH